MMDQVQCFISITHPSFLEGREVPSYRSAFLEHNLRIRMGWSINDPMHGQFDFITWK